MSPWPRAWEEAFSGFQLSLREHNCYQAGAPPSIRESAWPIRREETSSKCQRSWYKSPVVLTSSAFLFLSVEKMLCQFVRRKVAKNLRNRRASPTPDPRTIGSNKESGDASPNLRAKSDREVHKYLEKQATGTWGNEHLQGFLCQEKIAQRVQSSLSDNKLCQSSEECSARSSGGSKLQVLLVLIFKQLYHVRGMLDQIVSRELTQSFTSSLANILDDWWRLPATSASSILQREVCPKPCSLLKSAPTNREGQQLTTGKFMALHPEPSQFGVKSEKCVTSLRVFGKFLGSK